MIGWIRYCALNVCFLRDFNYFTSIAEYKFQVRYCLSSSVVFNGMLSDGNSIILVLNHSCFKNSRVCGSLLTESELRTQLM